LPNRCASFASHSDSGHQPTIRVDEHIKSEALTSSQPLDEELALPTALRALGSLALCSHASVLPVLMRDNQVRAAVGCVSAVCQMMSDESESNEVR
jgi:hypothetical protein